MNTDKPNFLRSRVARVDRALPTNRRLGQKKLGVHESNTQWAYLLVPLLALILKR